MKVEIEDVGFGYSPFPHELARDRSISLQAKGLFAVYGSFVKVSDPTTWASQEYLCKLCGGINEKTLLRYKKELLLSGWISQEQRRCENGQHSTMVITRYYHPSLNPVKAGKPKSSMISTGDQKTVPRKTAARKMVPQEQEQGFDQKPKKHTEQPKGVCVSPEVVKIGESERACIEWTISEYKKTGHLKNEMGLRVHLERAAIAGNLSTEEYQACIEGQSRRDRAVCDALQRVEVWEQEAREDPITADFFEEQKKLYPALFKSAS